MPGSNASAMPLRLFLSQFLAMGLPGLMLWNAVLPAGSGAAAPALLIGCYLVFIRATHVAVGRSVAPVPGRCDDEAIRMILDLRRAQTLHALRLGASATALLSSGLAILAFAQPELGVTVSPGAVAIFGALLVATAWGQIGMITHSRDAIRRALVGARPV
ncbi:MAG: hypothetical protein KDE03_11735 [Rhodobacteraceae bacterium]|nr:hypothetical protein [Paracoccaceae bacterium]